MSVLTDVAQKLTDLGYGNLSASPPTIHTDTWLSSPDNAVGVFGYGGPPPTTVMTNEVAFEYVNVQIQVRNRDPEQSELICYNIWQELPTEMDGALINTHQYNYCERMAFPQKLRVDDNERTICYCEFQIWKVPE